MWRICREFASVFKDWVAVIVFEDVHDKTPIPVFGDSTTIVSLSNSVSRSKK
jgi:hypothetical protein